MSSSEDSNGTKGFDVIIGFHRRTRYTSTDYRESFSLDVELIISVSTISTTIDDEQEFMMS